MSHGWWMGEWIDGRRADWSINHIKIQLDSKPLPEYANMYLYIYIYIIYIIYIVPVLDADDGHLPSPPLFCSFSLKSTRCEWANRLMDELMTYQSHGLESQQIDDDDDDDDGRCRLDGVSTHAYIRSNVRM